MLSKNVRGTTRSLDSKAHSVQHLLHQTAGTSVVRSSMGSSSWCQCPCVQRRKGCWLLGFHRHIVAAQCTVRKGERRGNWFRGGDVNFLNWQSGEDSEGCDIALQQEQKLPVLCFLSYSRGRELRRHRRVCLVDQLVFADNAK